MTIKMEISADSFALFAKIICYVGIFFKLDFIDIVQKISIEDVSLFRVRTTIFTDCLHKVENYFKV